MTEIFAAISVNNAPEDALVIMEAIGHMIAEAGGFLRLLHDTAGDVSFERGAKGKALVYLAAGAPDDERYAPARNYRTRDKVPAAYVDKASDLTLGSEYYESRAYFLVNGEAGDKPCKALLIWCERVNDVLTDSRCAVAVSLAHHRIPVLNLATCPAELVMFWLRTYLEMSDLKLGDL